MQGGDFQMMTAGSGVVYTETIDKKTKLRLLQLWLNLPKKNMQAPTIVQDILFANGTKFSENVISINLYSGSLAGLKSLVQNYLPMIVADISIKVVTSTKLHLPSNFNTFLYVLDGSM